MLLPLLFLLLDGAPPQEFANFYVSADDGEHWENVEQDIEHTFSYPGKNIKWKIDFRTNESAGYYNSTQVLTYLNVSTTMDNVSDLTFDFGDDGIIDFNISGDLNSTNSPYTVNLSSSDISDAFTSVRQVYAHSYKIPMVISSNTKGQLNIDAINLTYNPNPIVLNTDYIQAFLGNSTGFVDFSIPIGFIGGNVTINDVKYDYAGGNKTYTVLAHNGDYSINTSRNLTYYYSGFYKNLPYTWTEKIFFIPRTNSSKNISAYGQTDSIPVFNITATNYGGRNLNFSIKMNESFSCLNLTWNATGSTKPTNQKINTSWQEIASDLGYLSNTKVWFWADLENCNASEARILNPWIYLESYCKECLWSSQ